MGRVYSAQIDIHATTLHTAATWMLSSGIDIRSVAQVLGHTQASTTLSVYSHVLEGAEEKAIAAIDARFAVSNKG